MLALSYPVRISVLAAYLGQLLMVMAILTAVPAAVAFWLGDVDLGLRYIAVITALLGVGYLGSRIPGPEDIQTNEAMAVTALIFLIGSLVYSWPVTAAGLTFADAWFETISGLTTTGLSTGGSLAHRPATFLFARAWMQWTGGLGIIVLSLAAMIKPGLAAKRMGDLEDYEEDLVGGTRANARRVLAVYALLTLAAVVLLWTLTGSLFRALLYALATVSTGGFAPHDASLAALDSFWAQGTVTVFAMAGALPLILYRRFPKEHLRTVLQDRQLQGLIVLGLLTTLVLGFILWRLEGFVWPEALAQGVLNALSAQSTAGFSSMEIAERAPAAKLTLIFAMLVGGGVGSTAGGIKILRLLIILKMVHFMILKTSQTRQAVIDPELAGNRLEAEEIQQVFGLVSAYVLLIGLSWAPFIYLGYDPLDALFEVVSAVGTVGLSSGVTTGELPKLLKAVLGADMLLGRLEIFAWLVVFYPRTWLGRRMEG